MEINNTYAYDVEDKLLHIENIITPYITKSSLELGLEDVVKTQILTTMLDTSDDKRRVVYIKGFRYPVVDTDELNRFKDAGLVSDKPHHALLSVSILRDMIYVHAISSCIDKNTLIQNAILNKKSPIYPSWLFSLGNKEDVLQYYLPTLETHIVKELIVLFNSIATPICHEIDASPMSIYQLDTTHEMIILNRMEDIRAYRYNEAVVYNTLLTEVNDSLYKDNIDNVDIEIDNKIHNQVKARVLYLADLPLDVISQYVGLPTDTIRRLRERFNSVRYSNYGLQY